MPPTPEAFLSFFQNRGHPMYSTRIDTIIRGRQHRTTFSVRDEMGGEGHVQLLPSRSESFTESICIRICVGTMMAAEILCYATRLEVRIQRER